MARKPLPPAETIPAMVRFRQIAAEARDHLLLADGPPHPDADLLDLCAEALHFMTQAKKTYAARPQYTSGMEWTDAHRAEDHRLFQEGRSHEATAKPRLVRISRIRATTAAGIYAKAMVVRCSQTGAAGLAMTLAEDLIACPGLRAALWPAEAETEQPPSPGRLRALRTGEG